MFLPSTNADITFPNALKDKLILLASLSLSPVACVLAYRSLPAKSTRFNLPALIFYSPFPSVSDISTYTVNIECDRDESLFIAVSPEKTKQKENYLLFFSNYYSTSND